jgi:hypothetical protein
MSVATIADLAAQESALAQDATVLWGAYLLQGVRVGPGRRVRQLPIGMAAVTMRLVLLGAPRGWLNDD